MLGNLSIKSKLASSFIIIFILFSLGLWIALQGITKNSDSFDDFFNRNYIRQTAYQTMFADGLLSGVALRNLLLKPHLTKPFKVVPKAIQRFDAAYQNALIASHSDPDIIKALGVIDSHWQKSRSAKLQVLELMKAGDQADATEMLTKQEHPPWQKVRIEVQKLVLAEEQKIKDLRQIMMKEKTTTIRNTLLMTGFTIIIGSLIALYMTMSIKLVFDRVINSLHDIADGGGNLTQRLESSGSNELSLLGNAFNQFVQTIQLLVQKVATTNIQLIESAQHMTTQSVGTKLNMNQQDSKIEQVATAINEMTSTVQEVARNAAQASEAAHAADEQAADGNRIVAEVTMSINDLASEIKNTATQIKTLEENSEQMRAVIDVIKGIAEQTNLLALNAAIEAARAGEHGRGFAVVADEVRTLASRTQESTQEIQNMIEGLQNGAKGAVLAMEQGQVKTTMTVDKAGEASHALSAITLSVSKIADMNSQIATAAEEQTSVTEEINVNVVSISTLAEKAAQDAEETASSSQELEQLANELQATIQHFKV